MTFSDEQVISHGLWSREPSLGSEDLDTAQGNKRASQMEEAKEINTASRVW